MYCRRVRAGQLQTSLKWLSERLRNLISILRTKIPSIDGFYALPESRAFLVSGASRFAGDWWFLWTAHRFVDPMETWCRVVVSFGYTIAKMCTDRNPRCELEAGQSKRKVVVQRVTYNYFRISTRGYSE